MAIFEGKYINADYGDLQLTEELQAALHSLDMSCRYGCGGTWDIFDEEPEDGVPYRAVFNEMATDELVWVSEEACWTDGCDDEDDDDDDDFDDWDDTTCECEHEKCNVCNPSNRSDEISKEA